MASTDQHTAVPEALSEEPTRQPSSPSGHHGMVFAWAGALAAGAAAAALAVATLTPDDNQPSGRPLSERGTSQALEGSAEDSAGSRGSGAACVWTSDVNT
ncbi:MAG TPA: hypothetical protein VIX41_00165, partial [Acidimicrobiales bacterium]